MKHVNKAQQLCRRACPNKCCRKSEIENSLEEFSAPSAIEHVAGIIWLLQHFEYGFWYAT
jgi:hypothetical protein